MSKPRTRAYMCACVGEYRCMESVQYSEQNATPRHIPVPLKSVFASSPRGSDFKNFPQNHPIVGESFTSSNEFEVPVDLLPAVADLEPVPAAIVQPGEYHPGYCEQMLAFFDRPKMETVYDTFTWKSGAVTEKERKVPNLPPHFSEFARKIGVTTRTLKRWASQHTEFKEAYEQCQEIFEEFLIDNGLVGSYGAIAMKFVAVNRSKMKDKSVQENVTLDINKVLDKIAAGEVKPGGQMVLENEEF